MSTLSRYSFLPFLRQGIANKITTGENDASVKLRASIEVQIQLTADKIMGGVSKEEPIVRTLQLYGPGDIVGIENRAIIRKEPRNWITNFEPNYLAHMDFYDEDFPWRYTPAVPDMALHRLRPWIMLIVLKEDEFEHGVVAKDKPLPQFIVLKQEASKILPPADQLWAWAHVHVNRGLTTSETDITSTDKNAFLSKLRDLLKENADLAYSRILCPRHLEDNTAYHAFLIPTFESGRLAGLGRDLDPNMPANQYAWESASQVGLELPYYHRWYFRTGTLGDFEFLVRLLEHKPVDKRVGVRDMDIQYPGPMLRGMEYDDDLKGILKLGGALQVPSGDLEKYEKWYGKYPHEFQVRLASLINLPYTYSHPDVEVDRPEEDLDGEAENETDPDPLITPPLYGRWHALTEQLYADQGENDQNPGYNWIHQLNLDPRYRVAAGFGTRVIREKQEEYMEAAWEQIGDVLEANRRIREAQLAREVAWIWHERHLKPLYKSKFETTLMMIAPVQRRVVVDGYTIHHHLNGSFIPPSLTSPAMRRALRPGGRIMRSVSFKKKGRKTDPQSGNLLTRLNDISKNKIHVVPPKATPPGLPTTERIADSLASKLPGRLPMSVLKWLRRFPALAYIPFVLIAIVISFSPILALTAVSIPIGIAVIGGLLATYRFLTQTMEKLMQFDSIQPGRQTREAVDKLPTSPNFVLSKPGDDFSPAFGSTDSVEAQRFKDSLKDANLLLGASLQAGYEPSRKTLPLERLGDAIMAKIDPQIAVSVRMLKSVHLPDRIRNGMSVAFKEDAANTKMATLMKEAMAYPEFDIPMYKPLVEISSELFLPHLQYVGQNSITLLETNQRFIESYMVGLNHEFARELLWREYPTDQRGSYFRQFWDTSGLLITDRGIDPDKLRDQLRDIRAIHRWSSVSRLGEHRNQPTAKKDAVLVIRGELLKKYPTAVVYAHRAKWKTGADAKASERELDPPFDELGASPSRDKIRTPLYEAKIEPDIYFFGFDLTVNEAEGENGDPGWFFVIKERPGEPRFGLDMDRQSELFVWNDLSWKDVLPNAEAGKFIKVDKEFSLVSPLQNDSFRGKHQQYREDVAVSWNVNTNAAELAYILYQTPVLVAIHASRLLQNKP